MELPQAGLVRCIGCFSDENVSVVNIRNGVLQTLFKTECLSLCYMCKKLAKNTELFVESVLNNQIILLNITESTNWNYKLKAVPIIKLQSILINNLYKIEHAELPGEAHIKLEKEDIQYFDGFEDNTDFVDLLVKNEEVIEKNEELNDHYEAEEIADLQKNDEFSNGKIRCTKPEGKVKKRKKCVTSINTKDYPDIPVIYMTKEDCLKEKQELAKDESYIVSKYKCQDCVKSFIFKDLYDKHMKTHLKSNGDYECDICKKRMSSEKQLHSHRKIHTIRYKCVECGLIRSHRTTIKDHYDSSHRRDNGLTQCSKCPKLFKTQTALRKHKYYAHTAQRVKCDHCLNTYVNIDYLRRHILKQHTKDKALSKQLELRLKEVCAECGERFAYPSQLKIHMTKHEDSARHYCVECDKWFKTSLGLHQHLKNTAAHVPYSELRLQCDYCEKRFSTKRSLERHINRIHLDKRPFECDRCDKKYATQWNLTSHIRLVHEGFVKPRKYPCTFCDKVFKTNSTCKAHLRTHTGERPYKCVQCSATFAQGSALGTHVKLVHLKLTRDGRPKASAEKHRYDYN